MNAPTVPDVATPSTATPSKNARPSNTNCEYVGSHLSNDCGDLSPYLSNDCGDLGLSMKKEVMNTAAASRRSPIADPISLLSSDDDGDDFDLTSSVNSAVRGMNSARLCNRNQIFGYRFATPYIVTAHMGRNGPHKGDKVYDKEFMTALFDSMRQRHYDPNGWTDKSLLCNQLQIHSVKMMRSPGSNQPRQCNYSNGGVGYFNVMVRVLTKSEIKRGEGTDTEIMKWMEKIRCAYISTKTKYELRLEHGGILGRTGTSTRSLDTILLDADVADYAKMVYRKQYDSGLLINDPKKVMKFFAVTNAAAAKDLLG